MILYHGNIVIIGCGAVAQCSIPLILKLVNISPKNIVILDPLDKKKDILDLIEQGIRFEIAQVTKDNYDDLLFRYLKAGDICIDLANQVDTNDILQWCLKNNVMYLNTCLNIWPSSKKIPLSQQYKQLKNLVEKNKNTATAVLAHGANPGLISSFVKKALVDYAHHELQKKTDNKKTIEHAFISGQFNLLAQALDIKFIHITEKDSQNYTANTSNNTFFNTWSITEFINECLAPVEFAWGTHETKIPHGASIADGYISFSTIGLNSMVKSYILDEEFDGMIIIHDETHSIADYLSVKNNNKFVYRPTTLFAYAPCPKAQKSLKLFQEKKITSPIKEHVITHEIDVGLEKLGCLLVNSKHGWWTGSLLSIQESNRLLKGHNSTVLQVAAGVIAALDFMIRNPQKGICFPEALDYKDVLNIAKPYLGDFISKEVHWNYPKNAAFENYVIKI